MIGAFRKRLLAHLSHDSYQPQPPDAIAAALQVDDESLDFFRQDLATLVEQGKAVLRSDGKVGLPDMPDEIIGSFRKNIKGFGFVVPETKYAQGDLFIQAGDTKDALTGDTVKVKVYRRRPGAGGPPGSSDRTGEIIEVLKRKRSTFAGELVKRGNLWVVVPDGKEIRDPVVVRDPQAKNAYEGNKVIVEITLYPEGDFLAEGVITKVLGDAGEPDVETQATIEAYNLPKEFPDKCVEQARKASEMFFEKLERSRTDPSVLADREDLRNDFIITIDPPDAKDYDDAISIDVLPNGNWRVGVHIADVAHFIPPASVLDIEAERRGNSVYLPRLVIPMLPEVLSNGICSLQEAVERFCKSTFHEYDRDGNLVRSGVAQVIIKSAKRLTYLEAQALIDGDETEAKKHAKTEPNYTPKLIETLKQFDACTKAIRRRRRAAGMIHLDLPQVVLRFDDQGRVVDAEPEDDAYTHTLIEMLMVEANEVVARLFRRLGIPAMRRIHPEPVPGAVEDLRPVAKVAGYAIPKSPTRMELQKLLDATRGTPAAAAVHFAVLRTLTKAEYSPAPVGHFALASDAYSHFTSPIRRYADLTIHRQIEEFLMHTANGSKLPPDEEGWKKLGEKMSLSKMCLPLERLEAIGKAITITEENAASAESSLRNFLVMQLLSEHIGEEFRAIVTGVGNNGVFVKLEKFLVDGMIKTADLPLSGDGRMGSWKIDSRTGALVNAGNGRSFAPGDRMGVIITKIDLASRQMDLVCADPDARDRGKAKAIYDKKGKVVGGAGELGGGALNLNWDQIKYGTKTGAEARSQRSKARDKGKTNYRRDKD